jgi:hypothetical protein
VMRRRAAHLTLTDDALVVDCGGYVQCERTPLWWACDCGNIEVVKLLLAHPDVDINKADDVRGRGGVVESGAGRAEKRGAHYWLR